MTPIELFTGLKNKANTITDEELKRIFDYSLQLASKYKATGQNNALRKLVYIMDTIHKEHTLVGLGIDTYIYKDDIDYYIDNFSKEQKVIKIIELKNYTREIPDEVAEVVVKTKHIFDEMYIVFTDYTDTAGKRVSAEKRTTDPILFGVFLNQKDRVCIDRFYVLGDWEDPYCDLTLEKFVTDMAGKNKKVTNTIYTPVTLDELRAYNDKHELTSDMNIVFQDTTPVINKKSWFTKVKSWFRG